MTTRPLGPSEISLLEQALTKQGRHRDRLFLILAVSTAYRVSELLTLQFSQLTTPDGEVAMDISISRRWLKGGRGGRSRTIKSRRVPLGERARMAISDYLATLRIHPEGATYVFASRKGANRPITRCHAHHLLKSIAHEVGLDATRIGCHSARKSYAKGIYAASGFDLLKVQKLLGHSSPRTTALYVAPEEAELEQLARNFDPLAPLPAHPAAMAPGLALIGTSLGTHQNGARIWSAG